jgi:predicted CoA-binding protein
VEEVTMLTITEAAASFLRSRRIAVTGVSRTPASHGGNVVFDRLRQRGYEVVPVNPNAEAIDGVTCYPNLVSIPGGVDAVVIATRPEHASATIAECAALNIRQVWMHRAFGAGSVSAEAAAEGRRAGITVIEGGCPLMFEPASDGGHKFLRFFCSLGGAVPRSVKTPAAAPTDAMVSPG